MEEHRCGVCVGVVLTWSFAVVVEVLQVERARVHGEHAAAHAVLQRRQRAQLLAEVAHLRAAAACDNTHTLLTLLAKQTRPVLDDSSIAQGFCKTCVAIKVQ